MTGLYPYARYAILIVLTLVAALAEPVSNARAQSADMLSIVATVNDDVISQYDLGNRVGMVILLSGLPNTKKVAYQIAPQVLRNLIDETLRMQQAKKFGITATQNQINAALKDIAARNGSTVDKLMASLSARKIDPETLINRVTSDIVWGQVIVRRYGILVNVTDSEIDAAVKEQKDAYGKPEYNLFEIFLADDSANTRAEITAHANQLEQQLKSGASFPALAQSFSQLPTAANGGARGWVRASQLTREVAKVVQHMKPGSFSAPIPVAGGIYIIALRSKRIAGERKTGEATVTLSQFHLPVSGNASEQTINDIMRTERGKTSGAKSCAEFDKAAAQFGSPLSGSLGTIPTSHLPAKIKQAIAGLPVNGISPPIRNNDAIVVLMVCGRTEPDMEKETIDRESIAQQIRAHRLESYARQYIRDLRRAAFIDIRR